MSVDVDDIIPSKYIESVSTTQYTAPDKTKCVIDKFIVNNTTNAPVTITINVAPALGAVAGSNEFITTRILAAKQSYNCVEIVGRCLKPGDYISASASVASAVSLGATGRLITTT